jgi:hypothetical protein
VVDIRKYIYLRLVVILIIFIISHKNKNIEGQVSVIDEKEEISPPAPSKSDDLSTDGISIFSR